MTTVTLVTLTFTGWTKLNSASHKFTAREILGCGFYIPEIDIFAPRSHGFNIFKSLKKICCKEKNLRSTEETIRQYRSTSVFYKSVTAETGISFNLQGKFTMGLTLDAKTKHLSEGTTDVQGMSIDISTFVRSTSLDGSCFKGSSIEFTDEFMKFYDSLPVIIEKPWLSKSWLLYDQFLKTFGSHVVVRVLSGASVRQWTFTKPISRYTQHELKIKSCIDLEALDLKIAPCSDITKKDISTYKSLITSSYLEVQGGTDETRNKFRTGKSQKLLEQLLNEGRKIGTPVAYKYKPIWEILLTKFHNDTERYTIAMNLMQYFHGLKDFGCILQTSGDTKLRWFEYRSRDVKSPVFQCKLINEGCHKNSDCKIGGGGTVTYCYGSSCFEHKNPPFGLKAKEVIARHGKRGSYKKGVNKSCKYKHFFRAVCRAGLFRPKIIWQGGNIINNFG